MTRPLAGLAPGPPYTGTRGARCRRPGTGASHPATHTRSRTAQYRRSAGQRHTAFPANHDHGVWVLVPLQRRVPPGLDLEVAREEGERLFPGAFSEHGLPRHTLVGNVSRLVLANGDAVPGEVPELENLRSIIHRSVV